MKLTRQDYLSQSPDAHVPAGRLTVLDGLRGIAILLVMAFHLQGFGAAFAQVGPLHLVYVKAAGLGWAGVDMFFVLSGFLITNILYQMRGMGGYFKIFYARRILRIFPLYYLVLFLFFVATPVALKILHRESLLSDPLLQAPGLLLWTYLLNWHDTVPKATPCSPLLQHFWSLAIEEQFYLVWPWVVRAWNRRTLMWICLSAMVISASLRCYFLAFDLAKAAYELTICRLDGLAMGALIALGCLDTVDRAFLKKIAPIALNLGLFFLILTPPRYLVTLEISLFTLIFGGGLMIALDLPEKTLGYRLLSSRALVFFGKYSYALYIFHQPVFILLRDAGVNAPELALTTGSRFLAVVIVHAIYIGVSVMAALASWKLIEKPLLRFKEKFPWQSADSALRDTKPVH